VRVGSPRVYVLDAIGGLGGEDSAVEKEHGIGPEGVQIPSLSGSEMGIRYRIHGFWRDRGTHLHRAKGHHNALRIGIAT